MNKQAYDQGFIAACNANGVDPQELVKVAQLGRMMGLAGEGVRAMGRMGNKALYNKYTISALSRLGRSSKAVHRKLIPYNGKISKILHNFAYKLSAPGYKARALNKPSSMLTRLTDRASSAIGDFNTFGKYHYGQIGSYNQDIEAGISTAKGLAGLGAAGGVGYGGYKLNKRRLANR